MAGSHSKGLAVLDGYDRTVVRASPLPSTLMAPRRPRPERPEPQKGKTRRDPNPWRGELPQIAHYQQKTPKQPPRRARRPRRHQSPAAPTPSTGSPRGQYPHTPSSLPPSPRLAQAVEAQDTASNDEAHQPLWLQVDANHPLSHAREDLALHHQSPKMPTPRRSPTPSSESPDARLHRPLQVSRPQAKRPLGADRHTIAEPQIAQGAPQ